MTSYFNACDVTVATSNQKKIAIILWPALVPPPTLKKVPPPYQNFWLHACWCQFLHWKPFHFYFWKIICSIADLSFAKEKSTKIKSRLQKAKWTFHSHQRRVRPKLSFWLDGWSTVWAYFVVFSGKPLISPTALWEGTERRSPTKVLFSPEGRMFEEFQRWTYVSLLNPVQAPLVTRSWAEAQHRGLKFCLREALKRVIEQTVLSNFGSCTTYHDLAQVTGHA